LNWEKKLQSMMEVKFNDLQSQWKEIKDCAQHRINNLFTSCAFTNGPDVEIFEKNFSHWNGNKYTIGVSSGTEAIRISLESLNLEGEVQVYTSANTCIATVFAAEMAFGEKCNIHLIDHDDFFLMDVQELEKSLITNHKKGHNIIIPVHLYGQCCNMSKISQLAKEFNSIIVEDCAQAHGCIHKNNKKVGTMGKISAFSCYPGKNLGAAGDAGIIVTDDLELADRCKKIRNLGSEKKYIHDIKGGTYRLDTIQAIILDEKLKHLDKWNKARINVAEFYKKNINNPLIKTPELSPLCKKHVYHIFCLETNKRDEFTKYMNEKNIPTIIHYPIPVELTGAYKYLNQTNINARRKSKQIVSIPIHPFITDQELRYICNVVNSF